MFKFLTTILFSGISVAGAQTIEKKSAEAIVHSIDSVIGKEISAYKIPGAVVQIKIGERIVISKAYGYATRYDSLGGLLQVTEKMTTSHLFDIASLTKVVGTTTALMKLVNEGLIKVDDPIGDYLPAYKASDKKEITIRHLLTHTAGLYEWYPIYYLSNRNRQTTYQLISSLPLKYSVGRHRKYSDLGFTVLGQLIESVAKQSLEKYLVDSIFGPLGMNNTFYLPLQQGYKGPIAPTSFGNPYEYRMTHDSSLGFLVKEIRPDSWNGWRHYLLRGEVNDGNAWYASGGVSGAAGLFSTVEDLQKLVDLLLSKGMLNGRRFLKEEVLREFLSKDQFQNGLGWMMDSSSVFMKRAPTGSFGHTGFTGTSIVAIPEERISVIILINRQQRGLLSTGEYYNVSPLRGKIFQKVLALRGK